MTDARKLLLRSLSKIERELIEARYLAESIGLKISVNNAVAAVKDARADILEKKE